MAGCDTINPLALADLVVGGPLLSLQNFGKLPGTYENILMEYCMVWRPPSSRKEIGK